MARKMKKTELKGWRPSESPLPDGIRPTDVDRMAKKIQSILANSHTPNEAELALLVQVHLLCSRVIAYHRGDPILNQLNDKLSEHKYTLHRLGFKMARDIIPLNLWITRKLIWQKKERGELELEEVLKQVESKIGAK